MSRVSLRSILLLVLVASAPAGAAAAGAETPKCLRSETSLVASQPHSGEVGERIVVKTGRPGTLPSCSMQHGPGDWVIDGKDEALYVLRLQAPMLVLDVGTGPLRSLHVYDIRTRTALFTGTYDDNKPVRVTAGSLTFWMADGPASRAECPHYAAWVKQGFDVLRTIQVRLAPDGGPPRRRGGPSCMISQ